MLGAGFGGLELTTRLSEELGDEVDVMLIDKADGFIFGFSKLDVMFGKAQPDAVHHAYADVVKPGVRFVQTTITAIDPVAKRVETDAGRSRPTCWWWRSAPISHPDATPGLLEAGHEFYTVPGAFACRDVLEALRRRPGDRGGHVDAVQVPAGAERDGVARARLPRPRGLRDRSEIALVMPMGGADPAVAGGIARRCSRPSRSGASRGTRSSSCGSSTRPRRSPAWPTAARCPSTCSSACRCTGRRRWSRSRG